MKWWWPPRIEPVVKLAVTSLWQFHKFPLCRVCRDHPNLKYSTFTNNWKIKQEFWRCKAGLDKFRGWLAMQICHFFGLHCVDEIFATILILTYLWAKLSLALSDLLWITLPLSLLLTLTHFGLHRLSLAHSSSFWLTLAPSGALWLVRSLLSLLRRSCPSLPCPDRKRSIGFYRDLF